jgi:membrane protease YdiL (CAAX protease family)
MGMGRPDSRPENSLWAGFLLGAILIAGSAAVLWLLGAVEFRGATLSWQLFVFFPVLLVMAFHEELVCRSYLLQNFVDVDRPVVGIVVTSLLFALVHGMNPAVWSSPVIMINLVLAGVLLGLAYLVGRGVWFATALHFGWNLFQGPVFGFAVSGISTDSFFGAKVSSDASSLLTGGEFGLEGSLLCTGLEIAVIAYFLLIGRLRGEPIVPPLTVSQAPKAAAETEL